MSSVTSSVRDRRRREAAFREQGGLCYWCKKPMLLLDLAGIERAGKLPDRMCTIEHLYSKWNPMRGKVTGKNKVAACLKCNNARGKREEARSRRLYSTIGDLISS